MNSKLIFFLVILIPFLAQGQTINPGLELSRMQFQAKQVIPPSPEAAELGKYGNVPVSLFTGTPSISVPLVALKANVLSLPVSLSYMASGFKPEEIAPWTGLGWSLNAGGVITRSVLGDPDMDDNYFISPSPLATVPANEYDKQIYFAALRNRTKETQPDVYYYNFMGHSGKFLIYPDGQIISKEKNLLNIVRWTGTSGEKIYTITNEQGIQYEFSELEKTTITPLDDEPNAPTMVVRNFTSSWYLSKVTAPYGGEVLEFEYYSPTNSQSTINNSVSNKSVTYTLADSGTSYWQLQNPSSVIRTFHPPATAIWKKFIKKVTLKKNSTVIGYVDFESGVNERQDLGDADFDGERLLKKVKLYSVQGIVHSLIQQFELGYEYFGISQPEAPGNYRRLKLKTVQEISPDVNTLPSKPPYTFYYNSETSTMPPRFTSSLDHWGFYNGQSNMFGSFPNLIPTVNVIAEYIGGSRGMGANREPDPLYASWTVLEKLSYPTGGYTSFEYEGNSGTLFGQLPANSPVGGIRLKKMIDHSFENKAAVVKMYEYKHEDGTSSGNYTGAPYYYETSQFENYTQCLGQFIRRSYSVTISANSLFGLGSIQGSHIGYKRVIEYQTDLATNQPLGKTVFNYEIRGFNEIDDQIGNGDLKSQQVFDNADKVLQEVTNTYLYEDFTPIITNRKLVTFSQQDSRKRLYYNSSTGSYLYHDQFGCYSVPSGYSPILSVSTQYYVTENHIQQQRGKITGQTSKVWDHASGTYLTTTKKFTYSNTEHTYPTLTEEVSSSQEKFFTSIKYVADYNITCTPQNGSMAEKVAEMKSKNMMGIPIEKLQYREDAGGGNRRYVSGTFTEYKLGLPEKIYFLQAKPMPTSVTASDASCNSSQLIDANYKLAATITYYADMNIKEEFKTNDITTTYFWGYGKVYPVAKVVGKNHNESIASNINQAVLDAPSGENAIVTEQDKLRSLSPAFIETYTYKPMVGIATAKDVRGIVTGYEYDLFNRLINIKVDGSIVKSYQYNYASGTAPTTSTQSLFYNAATELPFVKQGCVAPLFGDTAIYKVPYSKHVSSISITDANAKATTDIQTNGQAYANSVCQCKYFNTARHVKVFKNDCPPEQGIGMFVWYDVPAGRYKSTVSQADADAMATAEISTAGQAYANANATCSCAGENKRMINGVCETGVKHYTSSVYQNGQYYCGYYYSFSNGSMTGYYYEYSSSPCPIDP